MMKPQMTIHDIATGETVVREMTDEEYESWLLMCADFPLSEGEVTDGNL